MMKKNRVMSFLILVVIGSQCCRNSSKTENTISSKTAADTALDTTMRSGAPHPGSLDTAEKAFVFNAGMDGKIELEAGQFVIGRTKNPAVKNFAQMMVNDHTRIEDQLMKTAKSVGLSLPARLPDQKVGELQKLKDAQREELDKKYIIMMINAHKKAIQLFDKAATFKNAPLRTFAVNTLPVLKHHAKMAAELGKKLNVSNHGAGDNLSSVEADTLGGKSPK